MSRAVKVISKAEAKALEARDKAGERLTAVEYADLAQWHVDRSVRLYNRGIALAALSMVCAVFPLVMLIVGSR